MNHKNMLPTGARTVTPKRAEHKWEFKVRFRRHAFGWKSQPAITRVKQAVSEIKQVARRDPRLAAEGAVIFLKECRRPSSTWTNPPARSARP